jgi:short-subunit dehydrogenase
MRVNGKVIVVTGAGSGIGREIVHELLRRGARVAGVDLRADSLAETASIAAAGEALSTHVLDVTDRSSVELLPHAVVEAHGVVDGVINDAGIMQPFIPVKDLDYETITRLLDVNLMGTLHMVKAFLPLLVERPEAHLANVSSMGGFFPYPGQTVYGASKAAVKLLTEGLYAELLDTRVGVSVIMPGSVATSISQNSGVSVPGGVEAANPRVTPADEAARTIVDAVEHNKLYVYVGLDARIMSIAIKLAPRAAIRAIRSRMKRMLEPSTSTA